MREYQEPTEEELAALVADPEMLDKQVFESGAGALTPKQRAEKVFIDHAYTAACSIVHLAKNANNENTRLRAAQYVSDRALGSVTAATKEGGDGKGDALEDMVKMFTEAQKDDNR